MRRLAIPARPDWRDKANASGFDFHTIDGVPYWDESAYYAFTLRQIEDDLEAPTGELHAMAMDLVDEVVNSEQHLRTLAIPEAFWDWIAQSWRERQPHLYGRMDLAYDGFGPAKLYELNYDTPTSLFEAAFFQWQWLEDRLHTGHLPANADQYNSIYESLVEAFGTVATQIRRPFVLAALRESDEDQGTVAYLRDCAMQAGVECSLLDIEDIGVTADGRYTDMQDRVIGALFKLYPLEDLFVEDFGKYLPRSGIQLIEPAWKAILSNKGILPLLWQKHPEHPNLLPAFFDDGSRLPAGWVRKPVFSREGANIAMHLPDGEQVSTPGPYTAGPYIRQAWHPLPAFGDHHPLIGSWVVGDRACGIGIREDQSLVTQDSARFVPHAIVEDTRGVLMA
ncbi:MULTISPECIES: glutathionylspermidine synthase family protein [Dyella]|uniref:Glutathionylspermidine synthase family protein n=2 Tax=Dyella TaxID=231454 RepID=A0A4R0YNV9_9GAMM|nr:MULTISPECIES: glutathionylspermidine synthase family protein [Dyella]TBR36708.1 glutathionylspermidine synthase family protein [Dyella terrae]TCI08201.1 glutathionylspermidine synthase family protein [Dyella soli]